MDVVSSLFKKKKTPEQVVSLLKAALLSIPGEDEREQLRVSFFMWHNVIAQSSHAWLCFGGLSSHDEAIASLFTCSRKSLYRAAADTRRDFSSRCTGKFKPAST